MTTGFDLECWQEGLGNWWKHVVLQLTNLGAQASPWMVTGQSMAYADLPQPTTPEPPADTDLGDLNSVSQPLFNQLQEDLANSLSAIGYNLTVLETLRSDERQTWLWGIGRLYQAAGRTGIVTNATTATGRHATGDAVDFAYTPISVASPDQLHAVLGEVAADHPEMIWGGNWVGLVDPAHWERRI
jgi:hypothetical protein